MLLYRENLVNSFIIPFFFLNNACFSFKLRPSVCIGTSKQSLRNLKVTNHLLKGDYYSKVISSEKKKKTLRPYPAVSRKVLGKTVDATIPKGNMGYDQYTVPDDCSCRTYFCCFPLALENTLPWPLVPILSNFFEEQRTQNHPQCLSWLSRALFPTTFLEIAVYSLVDSPHTNPRCVQLSDFFRFLFTLVLKSH